jgi:hypothetical protein
MSVKGEKNGLLAVEISAIKLEKGHLEKLETKLISR